MLALVHSFDFSAPASGFYQKPKAGNINEERAMTGQEDKKSTSKSGIAFLLALSVMLAFGFIVSNCTRT